MTFPLFRRGAKVLLPVMLLLVLALGEAAPSADRTVPLDNAGFTHGLDGWKSSATKGYTVKTIDAQETASGKAVAITISEAPDKPWRIQIRHKVSVKIETGQRVELSALMRSPQSLRVAGLVQRATRPFSLLVAQQHQLSPQWKRYQFGGVAKGFTDGDQAQVVFNLGFGAGEIQIADVKLAMAQASVTDTGKPVVLPEADLSGVSVPGLHEALGEHPKSIIPLLTRFHLYNKDGELKVLSDHPHPGDAAVRITTKGDTQAYYDVQAGAPLLASVRKGDLLAIVLRWRAVEPNAITGRADLGVAFETAGPPYDKSVDRLFTAPPGDWRQVVLPFRAVRSYAPKQARLMLRVGYGKQTIELSNLAVVNLGADVQASDLPRVGSSYGGAAPDAPWREKAQERIKKYRMGDMNVKVVDAQGQPVPGAAVHVEMTRHAFGFGTALNVGSFPGGRDASKAGPYLEKAAGMFNWGVLENAMKWPQVDDPGMSERIDRALTWMEKQGWSIRGHNLIWPSWPRSRKGLVKLKDDPEKLRTVIDEHIREVARRYAGRITAWDVINEPFKNNDIMKVLGQMEMARWLKIAHEADPHAKLYINDNRILSDPAAPSVRTEYYLDLIDQLRKAGAPLDGIGMQSHFVELTPIPLVLKRLDTFAARNLAIQITEFTMTDPDEQLQARYARDFLTACFSEPAVRAVLVWGFWEGRMFHASSALYRKDWSITPMGEAFKQLIHDTWWTRQDVTTHADGTASLRGYLGDYQLTVHAGGRTATAKAVLTREGANVRVQMGGDSSNQ